MEPLEYFKNCDINRYFAGQFVAVFDMNGLIVDDEPVQLKSTNSAISGFGREISEADWIKFCVGRKPAEYIGDFCPPAIGVNIDSHVSQIIAEKDKIYSKEIAEIVGHIIRPGVLEFINFLLNTGRPLAVATSTTRSGLENILGAAGLNIMHKFDFLVCGDDVFRSKPDPEIYQKVRSYFGPRRRYVVLEDAQSGVAASKAAGMTCIAVPNKFTLNQNLTGANLVIDSLAPEAAIITNHRI